MPTVTEQDNITFETLLKISERVLGRYKTTVSPSMQAALGAIWENKKYQEYIDENRLNFKFSTLRTQANLIYKHFCDYFHLDKLSRPSFKNSIQSLYLSGKMSEFSDILADPIQHQFNPSRTGSNFIGRKSELSDLLSKLKTRHCINIWGESGVGKTALVREFEERQSATNGRIVWTPPSSTLNDWISDTTTVMKLKTSGSDPRESLFKELFQKHWTLILDEAEGLDQIFRDFIRPLCSADCQSTFIVISRVKQTAIEADESGCSLHLKGLSEYELLFEHLGLKQDKTWHKLAQKYNFNTTELINIAKIVKDFFDGDVGAYLKDCSTVFSKDSLSAAAELEFSTTELRILTILNETRTMGSREIFIELQKDSLSSADIFDSMATLEHRAVISKTVEGFIVSPVVRKRLKSEGTIG